MVKRNDTDALWSEYLATHSVALRDQLVERYLPMAKKFARRFADRLPRFVRFDDLFSASSLGVVNAVQGFDPKRNVRFETYCTLRMHGEVMDYLRGIDWLPRLVRARVKKFEKELQSLQSQFGRQATATEVMSALHLDAQQYEKVLREIATAPIFSLNAADEDTPEQDKHWRGLARMVEAVEARRSCPPDTEILQRDACLYALAQLSPKDRAVLILYYFGNITMRETGKICELSESRICQIVGEAEAKLRDALGHRRDDFV